MHAYFPPAGVATLTLLATALAAPAHAATVRVTNCNDHGAGSLRNGAAAALDNDVIDMRGLSCSRILLTSGPVVFSQPTITLQGPGPARLAVDGGGHSSVLRNHQAGNGSGGLLRIRDLTVRNGRLEDPVQAEGGCVYGYNLELEHVSVHHCVVRGPRYVSGGGVAATRDLRLIRSEVYASRAVSTLADGFAGVGGAIANTMLLDHSRLCNNESRQPSDGLSSAGGGSASIVTARYSTVSHNVGGGLDVSQGIVERSTFSDNSRFGLHIGHQGVGVFNSTFSSNKGPGLLAEGGFLVQNTIAFNTSSRSGSVCEGGLHLANGGLQLEGNLVAHNTCDGLPLDFSTYGTTQLYIPSEGNLIMYSVVPVPEGTISADPNLLPLANNGGPTLTHALPAGSPAIDASTYYEEAGDYDQRGIGFRRMVGGGADIGAFERQQL